MKRFKESADKHGVGSVVLAHPIPKVIAAG